MQMSIIHHAMSLIEKAEKADTVERSPLPWSEDNSWRDKYLPVNKENNKELEQLGAARRRQQAHRLRQRSRQRPLPRPPRHPLQAQPRNEFTISEWGASPDI